jgi:hypothetical protein
VTLVDFFSILSFGFVAKIAGNYCNTVFSTAPNGVGRIVRIKASGDGPSTVVDGGLEGNSCDGR